MKRIRERADRTASTRTDSAQCLSGTTIAGRQPDPLATPFARAANAFTLACSISGTERCRLGRPTVQLMDNAPVPPCEPARVSRRFKDRFSQIGSFAGPTSQNDIRVYRNNKGQRGRRERRSTVCASMEHATCCLHLPLERQDRYVVACGG